MNAFQRWLTPAPLDVPGPQETKAVANSMVALQSAVAATWSGTSYASLSREGYGRNPVVHSCVRLIAQAVSSCAVLATRDGRDVDAHPLLALLDRPNADQTRGDLLEALVSHLLLSGDAFVRVVSPKGEGAGEARALHALRPDRVRAETGPDGWTRAWVVSGPSGMAERVAHDEDRPAVLHLRLFNPLDDARGLAPLAAAGAALDLHNASTAWNKALLDNSARPSGALVYSAGDANMTREQFDRLKGELEEGYAGAVRAGRPLLLEGGLDWKAMSLSPRDMDFMEARNGAARDIALAFGVPPLMIGLPGDNTYANYAEANRAFWRSCALPMANRVLAGLAAGVGRHFEEQVQLRVDEDEVLALMGERAERWAQVGAADFLSDDEKREAVGYAPRGNDAPEA